MFSKEQFLSSIEHETRVCKHLFEKNALQHLAFRPSENQRSLLEILQYLSHCGKTPTKAIVHNDWSIVQEASAASQTIKPEQFCQKMDEQLDEIKNLIGGLSEEALQNEDRELPMGFIQKLGEALVNFPLKFLTAYRMQLYLYLKQSGESHLVTSNCWLGVDKN